VRLLTSLDTVVIIEQVKSKQESVCDVNRHQYVYRTIDEYLNLFEASGLSVVATQIMGERLNGVIYRLIHVMCNHLPSWMIRYTTAYLKADMRLLNMFRKKGSLISEKRPVDIIFVLKKTCS
jgi:hypothetical protein